MNKNEDNPRGSQDQEDPEVPKKVFTNSIFDGESHAVINYTYNLFTLQSLLLSLAKAFSIPFLSVFFSFFERRRRGYLIFLSIAHATAVSTALAAYDTPQTGPI